MKRLRTPFFCCWVRVGSMKSSSSFAWVGFQNPAFLGWSILSENRSGYFLRSFGILVFVSEKPLEILSGSVVAWSLWLGAKKAV